MSTWWGYCMHIKPLVLFWFWFFVFGFSCSFHNCFGGFFPFKGFYQIYIYSSCVFSNIYFSFLINSFVFMFICGFIILVFCITPPLPLLLLSSSIINWKLNFTFCLQCIVIRIAMNIFLLWLLLNWIEWHLTQGWKKFNLSPTMDKIVLVTVDGLAHGATNEPMAFMLKDQVESSVGSWKKLLQFEHYK